MFDSGAELIRMLARAGGLVMRTTLAGLVAFLAMSCGSKTTTRAPEGEGGAGGAGGAAGGVVAVTSSQSSTGSGGSGGSTSEPPCDPPTASEILHAKELDAYGAVVATSTEVFWIELGSAPVYEPNGAIYRTSKCGGGARILVGSSLRFPAGLAQHGDDVYWTEIGTNTTTSPDWGKVKSQTATLALDDCSPGGIAADGNAVFWSTICGIHRVASSGGTSVEIGQLGGQDVAVDDTHVYWIRGDGGIDSVPKTGGAVVSLAPAYSGPCVASPITGLVANGNDLFWLVCGRVWRVGKDGTGLQMLFAGSAWPLHGATGLIAVDEHWVYWSQGSLGLRAVDRLGLSSPVTVDPGSLGGSYEGGVYVDDIAIYYADGANLRRVPKLPPPE